MDLNRIHTNTIIKELPTEGHSPLLVVGNDYQMYVAKNDKGQQPPHSLINECFASFCLNHWNILTPEIKIIDVANELIVSQDDLSLNHRSHYYNTPCFGSKFIESSIDVNALLVTDKKKAFNKLNNPLDVFHITLFDTWVENDDRKPTNYNLILEPFNKKFNIIPIDNAFIFSTMSYQYLNPDYVSVSVNDHLLVSDLGYLVKKNIAVTNNFINNERDYFYLCIERCRKNFDDFINQVRSIYTIDDDSVLSLKDFLFNDERNNKVFNEYVFRLNQ
ncbi:HipA family kinase [Bizionia sp. KMM 8389]